MTHWKKFVSPDSTYFGAQDFESLKDKIIVTIKERGDEEEVMNTKTMKKEKKGVLYFYEDVKPFICNVTNGKTLKEAFGEDADNWIGKKIELYYDPKVKFGRDTVGGVRVKAVLSSDKPIFCENCTNALKPFGKMSVDELASYTKKKYGKVLCSDCATQTAKAEQENNNATETE